MKITSAFGTIVAVALMAAGSTHAQSSPNATLESQQRAVSVLRRGIEAIGGFERLRSLKSVYMLGEFRRSMVGQELNPLMLDGGLPGRAATAALLIDRQGRREMIESFASDTAALPRSRTVNTSTDRFIYRLWNNTIQERNAREQLTLSRGSPYYGFTLLDAWERSPTLRDFGRREENGKVQDVIVFSDIDGTQVTMHFDSRTALLAKEETIAVLPPLGQVLMQIEYSDYRTVDGLTIPFLATTRQGGILSSTASLVDFRMNVTIDEAKFTKPANEGVRVIPQAVPQDVPAEEVEEVADGVYLMRRLTRNYHSMFIEQDDYVIAIEPVLTPAIGESMLGKIRETIPNKPVRYVVLTHFHFDHSGGLWPYIREGITIVTTPGNEAFIRRVAYAPRTHMDASLDSVEPKIELVRGRGVYGEGAGRLELYEVGPNPHVEEILLPYLPEHELAYAADIYGWGVQGTPRPILLSFADVMDRLDLDIEVFLTTHSNPPLTIQQFREEVERARARR